MSYPGQQGEEAEWRGLIVDQVDESQLLHVARGDVLWDTLPTRLVKFPVINMATVAILSWRWDFDESTKQSRNLTSALRLAKQDSIRYLFFDVISIDQSLIGEQLIEEVVAFSRLFRSIPVLAAYDKIDDDLIKTMRRPWILSEVRTIQSNPTKVTYISHNGQGVNDNFGFMHMSDQIRSSSFNPTILGVLCGTIGMTTISDFKFILPAFARILTVAHEAMCAPDYLLTTALLCQASSPDAVNAQNVNGYNDIDNLCIRRFKRYHLADSSESDQWSRSWTIRDILLDGTKVAVWRHKDNEYLGTTKSEIEVLPAAERTIFAALNQSEAEYLEYALDEESRRASLVIRGALTELNVDLVVADLQDWG